MAEEMDWAAWGAILTAAAGALGYALKKYTDWKVDKALAGQLDVIRKKHVARFEAVVRIQGMLTEIDHCMNHLNDGDAEYSARCKEWCMKVRQESRASIALTGEELMQQISALTDIALNYLVKQNGVQYDKWKRQLSSLYSSSNDSLKMLK